MPPKLLSAPLLAALLILPFLPARSAAAPAPPVALSEPAGWLQQYLRIDTSNPPGNEGRATAFLAGILQRAGIPSRVVANPEGRANLYARLSSPKSGGRAILLLHHMDVVPPGPGWTVPPFAGLVKGGQLWGRGAVDDKSLGIAQLAAMIDLQRDLQRRRAPLERDVIFLAVADEENGGQRGTGWLLANHPELFQGVEAVICEGGRSQTGAGGKLLWWGIEVAQKRPLWLEVATSGRGGHGAGLNPDSANHQLIQGLARLLGEPSRWRVTAPVRDYSHAIAPLQNDRWRRVFANIDGVIAESGPKEFLMPGMANLFLDTVQVTVLRGGERINVIPERAAARIDIRLLPDTDAAAFLATVKQRLGPELEVRVLVTSPPAAPSPASGRLYQAMERVLRPEGPVVPTFIAGFTDSRFFRERGIPAYGLSPFKLGPDESKGIHGTDEHIPLAEIDRGVERMRRILGAYATPQGAR
jgi:acetylornithine deacetylase/succinyl-diaminopimelate desuccinylase-like protein